MLKKVIFISLAVIIIGYIITVMVFLNPKTNTEVCTDLEIIVIDTLDRHFIKESEIISILKKEELIPTGKNLKNINSEKIEAVLEKNNLVKNAECYKTTGGKVIIEIYQKIPILRIFNNNGKSYYVDSDAGIMPASGNHAAYLPVASGYIDEEYAKTKLYNFALFLQNNKFWDTHIEQINVTENKDIELVPRIGNFIVILGKIDDYPQKLEKLKLFYDKGLNVVGWNKYSVINLKYKDQVVCKKNNFNN